MDRRRLLAVLAAPALAGLAGLAGCGGGLYIGWGGFDDPPSVSLAAGVSSAAPGQAVPLVAAAADDDYVREVDFFRVEPDGSARLLGAVGPAPYSWTATMPDLPRGSTVLFFARAIDSAGQSTDSNRVAVAVP